MPKLERLEAYDNPLSDDCALDVLVVSCPSLKWLALGGNNNMLDGIDLGQSFV